MMGGKSDFQLVAEFVRFQFLLTKFWVLLPFWLVSTLSLVFFSMVCVHDVLCKTSRVSIFSAGA